MLFLHSLVNLILFVRGSQVLVHIGLGWLVQGTKLREIVLANADLVVRVVCQARIRVLVNINRVVQSPIFPTLEVVAEKIFIKL